MRILAPLIDEEKAIEIIKKLWERKGTETIIRQLKNTRPITNFKELRKLIRSR